ncbi:hypothetical protein [Vibrio sp. 10N.261.52.A1]|uniref:hypothetical protein n=1 Tax=Vibrio TaxID=662 RepID=UPI000C85A30B|nr:hypothetical protein [Vibrio sp. 10N.261.52.A1]PML35128.1 hypothetical protein BCT81_19080 [Vibrio sp. 10N.261.52.A1]
MKEIKNQADILKYLTRAIAYYFTGADIRLVDEQPAKGQFEVTYQNTKVDLIATYGAPSVGRPQHRVQIKHYQYKKLHQVVSMVNGNSLNSFKILNSVKADKNEEFVPFTNSVSINPLIKKGNTVSTEQSLNNGEWSKTENMMLCEMFADQMTSLCPEQISVKSLEDGFGDKALNRSDDEIIARLELLKMTLKSHSGVLNREVYKEVEIIRVLRNELKELGVDVWEGDFTQNLLTLTDLENKFGITRIGKKATISIESLEALIEELQ